MGSGELRSISIHPELLKRRGGHIFSSGPPLVYDPPEGIFIRSDLSKEKFEAFLTCSTDLHLDISEQCQLLGSVPRRTFFRWKHAISYDQPLRLKLNTYLRIITLMEILGTIPLSSWDSIPVDKWLRGRRPSGPLRGKVPIVELSGADLSVLLKIRDGLIRYHRPLRNSEV
mgnify:CR=1 FL=1